MVDRKRRFEWSELSKQNCFCVCVLLYIPSEIWYCSDWFGGYPWSINEKINRICVKDVGPLALCKWKQMKFQDNPIWFRLALNSRWLRSMKNVLFTFDNFIILPFTSVPLNVVDGEMKCASYRNASTHQETTPKFGILSANEKRMRDRRI